MNLPSEQDFSKVQRNLRIIAFTIIEFIALIAWRAFVVNDEFLPSVLILAGGLFIEHVIAFRTLASVEFPLLRLIEISLSESAIWIIWLALTGINQFGAFVFLFVAMFFQHSVERNVFNGQPIFSDPIKDEVLLFTALEALSAGLWLKLVFEGDGLIGAGILAIGLVVEHFIQAKS